MIHHVTGYHKEGSELLLFPLGIEQEEKGMESMREN